MLNPRFYPYKNQILKYFDNIELPKLINKNTAISSMGSCFATNIGIHFIQNGYNYLIKEPLKKNADPKGLNPYLAASARWDFVYNTSVMRQIFEYSFTDFWDPVERWWEIKSGLVIDPFRRGAEYAKSSADLLFKKHRVASKAALFECKVFIFTLGLIELWRDKRDNMVFYRLPHTSVYSNDKHEFYVQTVDDVLKDLDIMYKLFKLNNPEVKIILTVSPVPFNASFKTYTDPVSANSVSKSVLRVAADQFVRSYGDVFYFPSYEIILNAIPDPFVEDGRHIKPSVISQMMCIFEKGYCHND